MSVFTDTSNELHGEHLQILHGQQKMRVLTAVHECGGPIHVMHRTTIEIVDFDL
jgi:hypothetical protein